MGEGSDKVGWLMKFGELGGESPETLDGRKAAGDR